MSVLIYLVIIALDITTGRATMGTNKGPAGPCINGLQNDPRSLGIHDRPVTWLVPKSMPSYVSGNIILRDCAATVMLVI